MKAAVKQYKGFKIEIVSETEANVYTAEEWAMGKGFRQIEWEACTFQEAKDFIDSY